MSVKSLLHSAKHGLVGYAFFPVINAPFRAFDTWRRYVGPVVLAWLRWIFTSREDSNFTYGLTERCKVNIAAGLAGLLGKDYQEIIGYFREIETDEHFNSLIRKLWSSHPERYRTDKNQHVGRRMVWYAFARATKPRIVIETGVDQGIGAMTLCAALSRNALDGFAGKYYGTDINPKAGYYLQPPYSDFGAILYGDSIKSLEAFADKIDLFINDSDHSADYERAEYEIVSDKLSEDGIILGDNSHVTPALVEFSIQRGRRFIFLSEEPKSHWYRGAGVGISTR